MIIKGGPLRVTPLAEKAKINEKVVAEEDNEQYRNDLQALKDEKTSPQSMERKPSR